jgi:hypothetical protein
VKIVVIGFNARGVKVSEADAIQFFGKRENSVAELSENLLMALPQKSLQHGYAACCEDGLCPSVRSAPF